MFSAATSLDCACVIVRLSSLSPSSLLLSLLSAIPLKGTDSEEEEAASSSGEDDDNEEDDNEEDDNEEDEEEDADDDGDHSDLSESELVHAKTKAGLAAASKIRSSSSSL